MSMYGSHTSPEDTQYIASACEDEGLRVPVMAALLSTMWKALSRDKHSAHITVLALRVLRHGVLEIKVCLKSKGNL